MDNCLQAQVAELKRVNHEQEFRLAALEALVSNYLSSIIFDADDDRPELPVDRIRAMLGRKGLPFYPHSDEDIASSAPRRRTKPYRSAGVEFPTNRNSSR